MIRGGLIAESIRIGAQLDGRLVMRRLAREMRTDAAPGQPLEWTVVEFEADDEADERLARSLAGALMVEGGWYANYSTPQESVVVFAGRVFRHSLGDTDGRAQAAAYGRSVGVPESQLDWTEYETAQTPKHQPEPRRAGGPTRGSDGTAVARRRAACT